MGSKKGSKSKKTKKRKKKGAKRSLADMVRARAAIHKKLKPKANLTAGQMQDAARNLNLRDTDTPLMNGNPTNLFKVESKTDRLEAFRFKDSDGTKVFIRDIGDVEDNDFGVADTINAIIEKLGFTLGDPYTIYMAADSQKEVSVFQEHLASDDDLDGQITFVTAQRQREVDNEDDNSAAAAVAVNNLPDPLNLPDPDTAVMNSNRLTFLMGEAPKQDAILGIKRSVKYKDVLGALDNYHKEVAKFDKAIAEGNDTDKLFHESNREVKKAYDSLQSKLNVYIGETTSKGRQKDKVDKKDAMRTLKDQLAGRDRFTADDFGNKTPYNTDISRIRERHWIRKFGALTDDSIDTSAPPILLGTSARGVAVYAQTFKGIPPFVAGVKMDDLTNSNADGEASGIPEDNPEQSKRGVAASVVNKFLGMNVIPETKFVIRKNAETGVTEFGQAIGRVVGKEGQLKGGNKEEVKQGDKDNIRTYLERIGRGEPQPPQEEGADLTNYKREISFYRSAINNMKKYKEVEGKYHLIIDKPSRIAEDPSAAVQKGLSDLQLFDNIIGHADRHGENFIFETASDGVTVLGVKGIDNDDTFGSNWKHDRADKEGLEWASKTPGLPPVIDFDTAWKLLELTPSNIIKDLRGEIMDLLPLSDVDATIARTFSVIRDMKRGIAEGKIQLATSRNYIDDTVIAEMEKRTNSKADSLVGNVKTWGAQTTDAHNSTETKRIAKPAGEEGYNILPFENSYLGTMRALGEVRGFE